MESQAAFVWAERAVESKPESTIDLDVVLIVVPWDPEHDLSFGFYDSIQYLCFDVLRMLLQYRPQRVKDFSYDLVELDLMWITL